MTLLTSWTTRAGEDSTVPGDGPTAAVAAVIDALVEPESTPEHLLDALVLFAWEAMAAGADLTCTLDDIDALWDLLEPVGMAPVARAQAHHVVTDAWVDAMAAERGTPGIDPLSGLHTTGYLVGRVHELDRRLGTPGAAHLVVLAVRWPEPNNPWDRVARILQVAATLADTVRPDATLSQFGATMALAVVPDDAAARIERRVLEHAFHRVGLDAAGVRVDVAGLPEDRRFLLGAITRLRDEPLTTPATPPPFRR